MAAVSNLAYRLFVALYRLRLTLGQAAYQFYLRRRKDHLAGADLSYLNLSGVNLSDSNLRGATLSRADLRRADLSDTDLENANLRGTNLTNADLSGASLRGATVTGYQLAMAKSLRGTTLPDGSVHE
jgi:uncharacterized protein YjbI with pentapeptide repeats